MGFKDGEENEALVALTAFVQALLPIIIA